MIRLLIRFVRERDKRSTSVHVIIDAVEESSLFAVFGQPFHFSHRCR